LDVVGVKVGEVVVSAERVVGETVGDTLRYTDGLEVGSAVVGGIVGAVVGMKDGALFRSDTKTETEAGTCHKSSK